MDEEALPKLGSFQPGESPGVFELVLDDHVPFVDPAEYGLSCDCVRPRDYFVTSGDAVAKARVLEKDLWALAAVLRKQLTSRSSASLRRYEKAVWAAAGRARALLNKLIKARGAACFLETDYDDHRLLCIPKNPRK